MMDGPDANTNFQYTSNINFNKEIFFIPKTVTERTQFT